MLEDFLSFPRTEEEKKIFFKEKQTSRIETRETFLGRKQIFRISHRLISVEIDSKCGGEWTSVAENKSSVKSANRWVVKKSKAETYFSWPPVEGLSATLDLIKKSFAMAQPNQSSIRYCCEFSALLYFLQPRERNITKILISFNNFCALSLNGGKKVILKLPVTSHRREVESGEWKISPQSKREERKKNSRQICWLLFFANRLFQFVR